MTRSSGVKDGLVKYLCLIECRFQDAGCTSVHQSDFSALIMLGGSPEDECFYAVYGKCLPLLRLILDKCLHADRYKWMLVIVMMTIEVCICQ
jgi:hypothetical protein